MSSKIDKQTKLTGAEYWDYVVALTKKYGYSYGDQLRGNFIGHFPNEGLEPKNYGLYVHPENPNDMFCWMPMETKGNGF